MVEKNFDKIAVGKSADFVGIPGDFGPLNKDHRIDAQNFVGNSEKTVKMAGFDENYSLEHTDTRAYQCSLERLTDCKLARN